MKSVFILMAQGDLWCQHFFPSPEAALSWVNADGDGYFLTTDWLGCRCLSAEPDRVADPIWVVELTQP